jgi:protein N-terminal methyltransferase
MPQPDVRAGIEYWNSQAASLDGVLGGYGSGVPVLYCA